MRDGTDVRVERGIVHIVDHIRGGSVFSEIDLDLTANEALRDYFSSQVANALTDDKTRPAKFLPEGSQAARDECVRLLSEPDSFITASRELARLLLMAMGTDQRIAPGSLAVCLYKASGTQFLALIKLDPGKALVQKVDEVEGKRLVSFDVQTDVMPTANERLHKAALIAPPGNAKYDLLLLDRQGAETAAFFAKTFLNTVRAFDAKSTVEALYLGIQNARSIAGLTAEESFAVQDWVGSELRNEVVTVSGLVRRAPIAKEKKKVFREEIEKLLPGEEELELDTSYAEEKLLRKTRLRGDYGVLFEVLTRHFDDVVKKQEVRKRADGKVITRLTIDVPDVQWIK
jgi:hypothetical protein